MQECCLLKAIALDFDGVILESVDLKTRAFRALFKECPEHIDRIVQFHLDNTGLSRYEKFEVIYREFFGLPLSGEEKDRLGYEFGRLVEREILECPFVPGAQRFLDLVAPSYPLFVISGTPESELHRIIDARGLEAYFRGVYGSPRSKAEILSSILAQSGWRSDELLFIGDSRIDYDAARQVSAIFIGRVPTSASSPFPSPDVKIVGDLAALAEGWAGILEDMATIRS